MIHNKLRKRLRHAADLLEALAGDGPPIEAMRDGASGHSVIPTSDADYVDMASGQMGVSGGVRQVNVDAQVKLRMAAIREVAMIKELLAELELRAEKGPASGAPTLISHR